MMHDSYWLQSSVILFAHVYVYYGSLCEEAYPFESRVPENLGNSPWVFRLIKNVAFYPPPLDAKGNRLKICHWQCNGPALEGLYRPQRPGNE